VRALELPRHLPLGGTTRVSDFLSDLLVSRDCILYALLAGVGRGLA